MFLISPLVDWCLCRDWAVAHATHEEFCRALGLLNHFSYFSHLLAFIAFFYFFIRRHHDTLLAIGFTFNRSIVTAYPH